MPLDPKSEAILRECHPDVVVRAKRVFEDMLRCHGVQMRVTEGIRSVERQKALYAQGRTKAGKVITNARPGYSFHHYGLAFDSCFAGADPYLEKHPDGAFLWNEFGRFARAHGFSWGGDFRTVKDRPHCQLTFGLSIIECLDLYKVGGNKAVWMFIAKLKET
jgi:peptidoglycan L-alanyl-D-glutamate endopeptidase CwlK